MGEYFLLVNPDKKEFVNPGDYHPEGGMKFSECVMWSDFPRVQMILTYMSGSSAGRWAGDRVYLLGDGVNFDNCNNTELCYGCIEEKYKDITAEVIEIMKEYDLYPKIEEATINE